jgi:hypothetical protein
LFPSFRAFQAVAGAAPYLWGAGGSMSFYLFSGPGRPDRPAVLSVTKIQLAVGKMQGLFGWNRLNR